MPSDEKSEKNGLKSSASSEWETSDEQIPTTHDWESYKVKDVFDDGTMTFFWQAHTLTVLFLLTCALIYVAIFEQVTEDSEFNTKRGLAACILVFLLLGVTQIPDGPFRRPHPALWRFVFCLSIVYELSLIFILFQTLMLRDWWLCMVTSIMFEILEYTLEHQLPNFSECWWDHWLMDAVICNGLGIYLGMKTLQYLSMKPYHWRGLWNIRTYKGKLKRIAAQFGPHSWIEFDWKPTSSLTRWLSVIGIIFISLLLELNTFYLKFVLWLEPPHFLNLVRLLLMVLAGAVSIRETFQYLDDPSCKTFGRQSWVTLSIIITEFLVIAKFDSHTITKPLPAHVLYFWILGLCSLIFWTIWNFFLHGKHIRGFKKIDNTQPVDIKSAVKNLVNEKSKTQEKNGSFKLRNRSYFAASLTSNCSHK